MNYETKRDVLEKLTECYAEVSDAYTDETGSPYYCDDEQNYLSEYDAALPDDLPTILECVSKEIKDGYGKNSLLDELAWANRDALPSSKVSEWINDNETLFAEAWSRGLWVVKETGEVTGYDD
ncbi:hypothetical protein [Lacticaseibacillus paracasei]|uniref:hypothetical protein n=1 Tax=Lacticaseibacillus paracasei TaxID=1597 RepID=UPI00124BB68C|nr:hypothetical protein [Lacticaseibacillus paracasei]KAB1966180.1 hypothetical protein F8272_05480 [Lacticaseibacillus paracasei]MCT3331538.1 hypothetical protein [Lacticaseibacillus paracasei]